MLSNEFERYAAADLHRPLEANDGVLETERLVSLVAGLLRQNHLQFLQTYKQEAVTAAQALLKQLMIEQLADAEDELDEIKGSVKLIQRVKAVHDVIKETAASSAGLLPNSQLNMRDTDNFLSLEEHVRVEVKLKDLLTSVCDYCNDRLASLISTQSDKQSITASQVTELSNIVESFTDMCENICGEAECCPESCL
ncbi:hypothetical protein NQ314_020120 [Rhamnusium bicolor]|uniref:Uncharacterized protein n=1 Tax=Rhamnusium bicolor TaxID=1586634 RepID=A0AAV8WLS5_9CUCU|nr:hypothetical protein NQ314_020120 [Rhamnusium bicolor]